MRKAKLSMKKSIAYILTMAMLLSFAPILGTPAIAEADEFSHNYLLPAAQWENIPASG